METAEVKESVPLTPDVETLEEEFTSIAAELKEAKVRDSAGEDTTSSDGEHTSEWLKAKTQELQEKILAKLPEDKREAWISKGQGILEQYGLVEESQELKNSFIAKGMELLRSNKELTKNIKKLATDTNVQNQVQEKLNSLKENELVKKSTDAFNIIKDDKNTKELVEETKKVAKDLLNSEEAKELTDISKTLFNDFVKSETVTSTIQKAKTTWDEKGDELAQKGKELTQKGIDSVMKGGQYLKDHEKDIEKTVKDHKGDAKKVVAKSEEMIDNLVENREKIAKMGIEVLKKVQEDDTGKQLLNKGLTYVKQIQAQGGIEAALKKGQENLKELKDNEEKRDELINKIKDTILDFVLKYLPNIPVPTIKGETNDIKYKISDIDLKGIKLKSQDVHIKFLLNRGKLDGAKVRINVENLQIKIKNLVWKVKRSVFPKLNMKGLLTCETKNARLGLYFVLAVVENNPQLSIKNPYLRLQNLDIKLAETSIAGFANTLIKMFKGVIRHQIEQNVHKIIMNQTSALLTPVNNIAVQYWPTINQFVNAQGEMSKVREVEDKDGTLVATEQDELDLDEFDVEFDEGSLGMELEADNDPKAISHIKVIGFTSGTFKKYQAEASGLIRPLDYITRVNGEDVIGKSYEEIVEMIVEAPRPLELTFARLMSESESESESESDKKSKKHKKHAKKGKKESSSSESESDSEEEKKSKKHAKKGKKEESSSESESEEEKKPKKGKKEAKKSKKEESSSESESEEEKKPKKGKKEAKKAAKKEESSSESESEEEKKPAKKAAKKPAKKEESSSESESESEEEKKPAKKAAKKPAKKEESSSESESESEEEKKPKKVEKKPAKKPAKKEESSSSYDSEYDSYSDSDSEDDKPIKKGNTTYRKI